MKKKIIVILFFAALWLPFSCFAQEKQETKFEQLDIFDVLRSIKKEKARLTDTVVIKPNKLYISAFPVIGYNPALGIVVGATFNPAIFFGDPKNTPISAFATNLQVTSKHQLLISLRSSIFTSHANLIFKGDWRFFIYYQPTYGLGSNIRGVDSTSWIMPNGDVAASASSEAEPMKYDFFRFYETVNKRVTGRFYIGGGYQLDYQCDIVDSKLDLDPAHLFLTQHYLYSTKYGFNPESYCVSGLVLSLLYDSRDNSCRPTKGYYASIMPKFNLSWIGSSQNSMTVYTEFRTYVRLSPRNPSHLIAFWYSGGFLLYGHLPYLDLPAIGWDTYGRSGRGLCAGKDEGCGLSLWGS